MRSSSTAGAPGSSFPSKSSPTIPHGRTVCSSGPRYARFLNANRTSCSKLRDLVGRRAIFPSCAPADLGSHGRANGGAMHSLPRILVASAVASLAAACTAPSVVYYEPPASLTPDQAVSVLGSKDPKFLLQSSEYRLVWAVDGKLVRNSAYRWDKPLLITANEPHRLSLGYGWGATTGSTDVTFTGKPGTA